MGITECIFHDETSDWVMSVSWSPDGRYIASGSFDKTVQIWDTQTGGHIVTYEDHRRLRKGKVHIVAWSPNGNYIASVSDKMIQVWNVTTGDIFSYQGHSSTVKAISWSPDGGRLASISYDDKRVHVCDVVAGDAPFLYTGHADKIIGLVWSPDGTKIASYSKDNSAQIWQAI